MRAWLCTTKQWAKRIKVDVLALWIAARDPRTPIAAKLVAATVSAYALSPIDLIPDFIPILGYLDDLVIVPLGILLAVKLIPRRLMADYRAAASAWSNRPVSKAGLAVIVALWLLAACGALWMLWPSIVGM